jgi:hypothetical protein
MDHCLQKLQDAQSDAVSVSVSHTFCLLQKLLCFALIMLFGVSVAGGSCYWTADAL